MKLIGGTQKAPPAWNDDIYTLIYNGKTDQKIPNSLRPLCMISHHWKIEMALEEEVLIEFVHDEAQLGLQRGVNITGEVIYLKADYCMVPTLSM